MKFLAFSDVHENHKSIKELLARAKGSDIDFIICAGDFSTFGRGMKTLLKQFNDLGKRFFFVPGNHEEHEAFLSEVSQEFSYCINLDQQAVEMGDYLLLGYGGGGFAQQDQQFRKKAREWYGKYKNKKIILTTHGPPFATKLDRLDQRHVGNKDYRRFIERIKPKLAISGHLHETAGVVDTLGKTKLVNPGWEGMVIELK